MKDLTEYLHSIKIKKVGFDYKNEEQCLKALSISINCLKYMDSPSLKVQYAALARHDGMAIEYIKNPSEEIQLKVVNINGRLIKHIDNPTEDVVLAAVKQNKNSIKFINIERLSESTKELLMLLL